MRHTKVEAIGAPSSVDSKLHDEYARRRHDQDKTWVYEADDDAATPVLSHARDVALPVSVRSGDAGDDIPAHSHIQPDDILQHHQFQESHMPARPAARPCAEFDLPRPKTPPRDGAGSVTGRRPYGPLPSLHSRRNMTNGAEKPVDSDISSGTRAQAAEPHTVSEPAVLAPDDSVLVPKENLLSDDDLETIKALQNADSEVPQSPRVLKKMAVPKLQRLGMTRFQVKTLDEAAKLDTIEKWRQNRTFQEPTWKTLQQDSDALAVDNSPANLQCLHEEPKIHDTIDALMHALQQNEYSPQNFQGPLGSRAGELSKIEPEVSMAKPTYSLPKHLSTKRSTFDGRDEAHASFSCGNGNEVDNSPLMTDKTCQHQGTTQSIINECAFDTDCARRPTLHFQTIIKRSETGEFASLHAPARKRNKFASCASDAVRDVWLSGALDVALRATGHTWTSVTPTLLLTALRETMRTSTSASCACLLLWSLFYHVSIHIFLRQLITWLYSCPAPHGVARTGIISNSTCIWINHTMPISLNHSVWGLIPPTSQEMSSSRACTDPNREQEISLVHPAEGLKWSALLFVTLMLQAGALQASLYISARAAGLARSRLMSLLFGKALTSNNFCDNEMRDSHGHAEARRLFSLIVPDVEMVVKAEQYRHVVIWILPTHCLASVLLLLKDMSAITMLLVLVAMLCTGSIVFALSYIVHIKSARSQHRASQLRVDRAVELLDNYVDLVLLGWQSLFVDAIQDAREVEHERVCAQAIIKSVTSTWAMIAGLLNVSCVLLGGSLFGTSITPGETSPPALSSPGLIVAVCQTTSLTCAVAFFTVLFPKLCRTQIALQRMVDLLVSQDRDACDPVKSHATFHVEGQEGAGGLLEQTVAVRISGATFVWRPKVDKRFFRLGTRGKEISLTVRRREILGVVAPKCEGKSSFLCAIAGLMPRDRGQLQVAGRLFLCNESPLLIDGTIQENILFGLPYDEDMYDRVVYCACLDDKLESLSNRDLTRVARQIGSSTDSNFIGGALCLDKALLAAISLARAIYADADVYLFDNTFFALGPKDSLLAWNRSVKGQLKETTVIVACNSTKASSSIMKDCDRVAVLGARRLKASAGDGVVTQILELGSYIDLLARGIDVGSVDQVDSVADSWEMLLSDLWTYKPDEKTVRLISESARDANKHLLAAEADESVSRPSLGLNLRWVIMAVLLACLSVAMRALMGYLLLIIDSRQIAMRMECVTVSHYETLVVYAGCILFFCMLAYAMSAILWLRGNLLCLAHGLHTNIMEGLRAAARLPLVCSHLWAGLGTDALVTAIECMDERFPEYVLFALQQLGCVFAQLALCYFLMSAVPVAGLMIAPILFKIFVVVATYQCFRCLRLYAAQYCEGLQLVREFCFASAGALSLLHTTCSTKQFRYTMDVLINDVFADDASLHRTKFAMALAIDLLGACLVLAVALALSFGREKLFETGSMVVAAHLVMGLIQLSCHLHFAVFALVSCMSTMELQWTPANRWLNMLNMNTGDSPQQDKKVLYEIPSGNLILNNITVVHKGQAVLRNINLQLKKSEYVVILGEGGAGKTTMGLCVLRAVYPVAGSIEIGNTDIQQIHHTALRKFVGFVSSKPILFSGSMLANLDPTGLLQPSEILPLLIAVGLIDKGVRVMPEAMRLVIQDVSRVSGTVKQLICLCRVLLRNPQLLILDEFGANIDGRRIRQIDRFLRTQDQFSVLQLSRNIQHAQHCARVAVLHHGKIVEHGKPATLLQDQGSRLRLMASQLGPAFLNKFRCDVDLWEAKLAEKQSRSLRMTMLQQLEAEWDSDSMERLQLPIVSPSGYLRASHFAHLDSKTFHTEELLPVSGIKILAERDSAFQMQVARACIAWLHSSMCGHDNKSASRQQDAKHVFFQSLRPQQRVKVEETLKTLCDRDSSDIRHLTSDFMVVSHVMMHALSAHRRPLLSPSIVKVVNKAHAEGRKQMELVVERILEDDDPSIELLIQLLWLLWSLVQVCPPTPNRLSVVKPSHFATISSKFPACPLPLTLLFLCMHAQSGVGGAENRGAGKSLCKCADIERGHNERSGEERNQRSFAGSVAARRTPFRREASVGGQRRLLIETPDSTDVKHRCVNTLPNSRKEALPLSDTERCCYMNTSDCLRDAARCRAHERNRARNLRLNRRRQWVRKRKEVFAKLVQVEELLQVVCTRSLATVHVPFRQTP